MSAPDIAEKPGRNLLMRVLAALVLAPLTIGIAWLGGWPWALLVMFAASVLFWEWTTIVGARTVWVIGGLLYAAAAGGGSVVVRLDPVHGFVALIFVLLVVWAADIGGYFAGRGIGGPKLAPRVSPKKTWAGAIGGTVASLIVAAGFALAGQGALSTLLGLGGLLSIVSQLGDLFESAVKRHFGVKDSSQIIPGHGGLLDRLDGFVAAIAVAALIGAWRGGVDGAGRGLMVW